MSKHYGLIMVPNWHKLIGLRYLSFECVCFKYYDKWHKAQIYLRYS